jgi:hypothetical protein
MLCRNAGISQEVIMKVFFHEIRKIWRWPILLFIVAFCALFYQVFMSYYIVHFYPSNHPRAELYDLSVFMLENYGETLEPQEFDEFRQLRSEFVAEAERYIATEPQFADNGIDSFSDWEAMHEAEIYDTLTDARRTALRLLYEPSYGYIAYKINAIDSLIDDYVNFPKRITENIYDYPLSGESVDRIAEIIDTKEYYSVLPGYAADCVREYILRLTVLVVLAAMILIAPPVTSDRAAKLHHLQYPAKVGRKILNRQFGATMISAGLLTLILFAVFGAIFARVGTQIFWNCSVCSFASFQHTRADMTYGGYILILTGLSFATMLATAALAFICSRFSAHYISLLFKLMPLFAASIFLCRQIFRLTLIISARDWPRASVLQEPVVCSVFLVAALCAVGFVLRREKRVDVA